MVVGGKKFLVVPTELGDEYYGRMLFDKGHIQTHSELMPGTKMHYDTLRHEMVHASFAMAGLNHILKDEQEEAVVRCLENIFFPALDNIPEGLKRGDRED